MKPAPATDAPEPDEAVKRRPSLDLPATDELDRRVVRILERHQTHAWLSEAGAAISAQTRFDDLLYDAIDQCCIAAALKDAFSITVPDTLPWPDTVGELTDLVSRGLGRKKRLEIIQGYFASTWQPFTDQHVASGWSLIKRIKRYRPDRILDLGCGDNQFKPHFSNLVGLDVCNPKADVSMDVLDYDPHPIRFDLILALGSINFGSEADILDELRHTTSLLAPGGRIIMRVNPGIRWADCPDLEIFPWTLEAINRLGRETGLRVEGEVEEDTGRNGPRYVFVYRKMDDTTQPVHRTARSLPRQPSVPKVALNVVKQSFKPFTRKTLVFLKTMLGGQARDIETTTDKVIWVSFPAALSGHAVARIISASPDVYWNSSVQKIEPLQLQSPHDWMSGLTQVTCHYADPMTMRWPVSGPAQVHNQLRARPGELRARLEDSAAQDLPFVQTVHASPADIARVFPNCRIVSIVDTDPYGFWLRTYHEKKKKRLWPKQLQKELWRGQSLEDALSHSPRRVPLHDGRPISVLQYQLNDVFPDDRDVRRYYRRKAEDFKEEQRTSVMTPHTIQVDRGRLFDPETCVSEYERLCRALQITAVSDDVAQFCRTYMSHQWRRPLPGS